MKFLFDLFPVVLFFVAYKLGDIYLATGVAMVASVAQIGWLARATGRSLTTSRTAVASPPDTTVSQQPASTSFRIAA